MVDGVWLLGLSAGFFPGFFPGFQALIDNFSLFELVATLMEHHRSRIWLGSMVPLWSTLCLFFYPIWKWIYWKFFHIQFLLRAAKSSVKREASRVREEKEAFETMAKKLEHVHLKARLHMRFFMRFRCDFGAILRTKPAPAYPARVFSRVTLRRNTVKLAGIGKKGVFK